MHLIEGKTPLIEIVTGCHIGNNPLVNGLECVPRWIFICATLSQGELTHDDVIKWKHSPRHWPFVWGIHRSPVNSPHRPVTRTFDVFFDLRLNKRLSKQSWDWWFETPSRPLWHHCNVIGPWEICIRFLKCNFQSCFPDRYLQILLWYCPQMNVMGPCWW